MDVRNLPADSRLKNPALGAGSLLDIGIYSLTWGLVCLDPGVGEKAETPKVVSSQTLVDGIDVTSSMMLYYPSTGRQGILTSTTQTKTDTTFARIEGSKGVIKIEGPAGSAPESFTVILKGDEAAQGKKYDFEKPGRGFYWEADACALDIQAGRTEDETMPWAEKVRVMEIMDKVRREGGARFPVDEN